MISAQADATNASAKLADVQLKAKNMDIENQNRDKDRSADLSIAATKLKTEQVIHGTGLQATAASQLSKQAHERGMQANDQLHEAGLAAQQNAIPSENPPMSGARKARDGEWYLSDPERPGKYLHVAA